MSKSRKQTILNELSQKEHMYYVEYVAVSYKLAELQHFAAQHLVSWMEAEVLALKFNMYYQLALDFIINLPTELHDSCLEELSEQDADFQESMTEYSLMQ